MLAIVRDLSDAGRLQERQQRFLSVAAHEPKTPLTAIIGIADLLEGEETDPDARRRLVGHLANEARRARELSETLLGIAGTGHDGRDPRPETVDTLEAARAAAGAWGRWPGPRGWTCGSRARAAVSGRIANGSSRS